MLKTLPFLLASTLYFGFVSPIGAEAAATSQQLPTSVAPSAESKTDLPADTPEYRRNGMSLELLGRGLLYSFNYDYLISDSVALGAGVANYSFSSGSSSASAWIIPIYANYYLTGGRHRWFATGGANLILASGSTGGDDRVTGSGVAGVVGGGYEYRSDGGFLFRAAPYVFVGKASGAWLGVSFGYAI